MLTHVGTLAGGHKGCVNRLAWSPGGDKLASVSDDTDIIVWGWEDGAYPPLSSAETPARPRMAGIVPGAGTPPAGAQRSAAGTTFGMRMLTRIDTGHTANVFGVKFLPYSNDRVLVTGGMDGEVRLHALDHGSVGRRRARTGSTSVGADPLSAATSPALGAARSPGLAGMSPSRTPGLSPSLPASRSPRLLRLEARFGARHPTSEHWFSELRYTHRARVKNVEVAPDCPHLFWSASEDSTVCQFDVRESVASQRPVLLTLAQLSDASRWLGRRRAVPIKHMAINPVRPHLLALACGDSYLRVYDRRMLPSLGVVLGRLATGSGPGAGSSLLPGGWSHTSSAAAHGNVLRFAPLHLAAEYPSPDIITPSMSYALQGGRRRGASGTGPREGTRHPSLEPTLAASRSRRGRDIHATHVDWDESGRYIAGSYHADGVYEFDALGIENACSQYGTEGMGHSFEAAGATEMEECLSLPALRPSQLPISFGRGCEHGSPGIGLGSAAPARRTTFRAHQPQALYTEEPTQEALHAIDVSTDPFSLPDLLPASVSSHSMLQPSAQSQLGAASETASSSSSVPAPMRLSLRQQLLEGPASGPSSSAAGSATLRKGPWVLKEAGNAAFRKGKYTHAIALYSAAIGLARSDLDAQAARTGDVQSMGQQSSEPVETVQAPSPSPTPSGAPQGLLAQRCNELGLALLYANRAMAYNKRGGGGDGADAVLDCARASSLAPLSWKVQLRMITSLQTAGYARTALAHARAFISAWSAPDGGASNSIAASDERVLEIDRAVSQAREEEVKLAAQLRKEGEVTGPADVLQLLEEGQRQREAEARACAMATAADTPTSTAAAGQGTGGGGGGSAAATGGRSRRNAWLRQTAAHSDRAATAPPASSSQANHASTSEHELEDEDGRMSELELHTHEAEAGGSSSSSEASSNSSENDEEETDGSDSEADGEEDEAGAGERLPGEREGTRVGPPGTVPVVPLLPTLHNAYKGWISTGVEPSNEPIAFPVSPALPSATASTSPVAAASGGEAPQAGCTPPAAWLLEDPYEPALHCTRHAGRYVGHSNVQTDIKECAFWAGPAGPGHHHLPSLALSHGTAVQRALLSGLWAGKTTQDSTVDGEDADAPVSLRDSVRCARGERGFMLSGSDDGRLWVYDRLTSLPVAAIGADEDVLNAVRPHPTLPLIATSGIESVIRLWAPRASSAVDEIAECEVSPTIEVGAAVEHADTTAARGAARRSAAGARDPLDQRSAALARLDLRAADVHALLEIQDRRVRSGPQLGAAGEEEEEGPFGGVSIPAELMRRLLAGALQAGDDDEGGVGDEGEGGAGTRVIRCANQ